MTKKGLIFMCLALLMGVLITHAESISVTNLTIEPGQTGNVSISLNNTATNLVSFQMDLTLPEGVAINKSGCTLSSRFTDGDQELTIGKQGDNVYRLTSTSFALTPISGTSGEIITLSLAITAESEGGTANISNIRFVTSNSERVSLNNVSFNISIVLPSPAITFADDNVKALCIANWETNGDGELSEAEAAAVTSLSDYFMNDAYGVREVMTSFDELQYFTGLTSLNAWVFCNCVNLTSVIIPNSVTTIENYAFQGCSNLTSITIPDGVTTIENYAFQNCSSLTSITIPESVTSIGDYAFSGCNGLESIVVEAGNPVYDSRNECNAIIETASKTLITGCNNTIIPEGVTQIGNYSFRECSGLTSIIIPNSVTSIGSGAFEVCSGLTSITIPSSVTSIGDRAFSGCSGLTSITIGNSVTSIGERAFSYCSGLTSVSISNSVTSIDDWAFYGCSNLTSVTINIEKPLPIWQNHFSTRADATLYVPYGCKAAYEAADYWKEFKEIVEMPGPAISDLSELSNSKLYTLTDIYGTLRINGNTLENSAIIQDSENMGLVTNVSQLSSPYTEPTEGSLAELLDNNAETYWHSIWTGGEVAPHTHYLQVDLTESVNENICMQVTRRQSVNDHISQWGVYGSNSATAADSDWEDLASVSMPYVSNTETRISAPFDTKGYRYLRFYIDNTTGEDNGPTRGFGHLSEFRLYKVSDLVANSNMDIDENSQFAILNINNKYYLYSPTMRAFWLAQGSFCPGFGSAITVTDNDATDDYKWTMTMPLDNQTISLNFTGNPYRITPVADFDPTEALAAFAENTILGLSDGYYRIRSVSQFTNTVTDANGQEGEVQVYKYMCSSIDDTNNSYGSWCTPENLTTDLPSLWKLTNRNGYYDLQNAYTKGRFTTVSRESRTEMSEASESLIALDRVTQQNGQTIFNIRVASQNMGDYYYLHMAGHSEGHGVSGELVGWCNTGTDDATEWILEPVSDEEAASITSVELTDISQLDNAIYIEPFSARIGANNQIMVKLKNSETVTGYIFDLVLPEGLTIAADGDGNFNKAVKLSSRNSGATIVTNKKSGNIYSIIVASTSSLTGNDGLVLTIKTHVQNDMAAGTYPIVINNSRIVYSNLTQLSIPDTHTSVTTMVADYMIGDVNDDGETDLLDAVLILYYSVGKPVPIFVEEAGDVNKDGEVDLLDAVLILYYSVGKIPSLEEYGGKGQNPQ